MGLHKARVQFKCPLIASLGSGPVELVVPDPGQRQMSLGKRFVQRQCLFDGFAGFSLTFLRVECIAADHQVVVRGKFDVGQCKFRISTEYLRWPSLEQIVRDEEHTNNMKQVKNKAQKAAALPPGATLNSPGSRQLPEANNSVPLPPMVAEQTDLKFIPKALPARFTGFTLEIARADKALVAERDTILRQSDGILMQREKQTKQYAYFVGQFKTVAEAQAFLENEAQGKFPEAKVVEFKAGKVVRKK